MRNAHAGEEENMNKNMLKHMGIEWIWWDL